MMKKLAMAFAASVATVFGLFAATYDVATSAELVAAVTSAGEGDEIVLAQGNYTVSAPLGWHAGATDVYGRQRVHGKKGVDIGAVECQSGYGLMVILR